SVRRKSRNAQDTLADATAFAAEQVGAVRIVQAFTNETMVTRRFAAAVETAFQAARSSVFARAILTFFVSLLSSASVVAVLWVGSRDVLAGTMTAGTLGQSLISSVLAAGAQGSLSEGGRDLSPASGASARLNGP